MKLRKVYNFLIVSNYHFLELNIITVKTENVVNATFL
jgi:hypothetical protein